MVRLLRGSASWILVGLVALLTVGCSLVEMPSNSSLAGPPPKAQATTPSPAAKATRSLTGPTLEVVQAERQSANANSMSATLSVQLVGAVDVAISGKVDVQGDPTVISEHVHQTVAGQSTWFTGILDDSGLYLKSKALTARAHGRWIEITFAELSELSPDAGALQQSLNNDPISQSKLLLASQQLPAADHLRQTGHRVIEGTSTTAYTGYFTPAAALSALPANQRAQLGPYLQQIQGNIHFYLWIGPGSQIKKLTEVEHLPAATIKVSYTINSIDEPLNITVPPASKVIVLPATAFDSAPGGVIG
jgi:hypothetical protein